MQTKEFILKVKSRNKEKTIEDLKNKKILKNSEQLEIAKDAYYLQPNQQQLIIFTEWDVLNLEGEVNINNSINKKIKDRIKVVYLI